jgi:hypothetical protein
MALSEDQIRTAFRMLDIPYSAPLVLVDQIALNTTSFTSNSGTSAQTRLRAWLDTGMDASSRTKAGQIIDEYNVARTSRAITIAQGNVGDLSGVNYDPSTQIGYLIGDLQNLVPFYKDLRQLVDGGASGRVTYCEVLC